MRTITWVTSDADWEALYVDGRLVQQDHRIRTSDAMFTAADLKGPFEFKHICTDTKHVDEHGEYPEDLKDVKAAY